MTMDIQSWIDNRFGVPNTFNTDLLVDFLRDALKADAADLWRVTNAIRNEIGARWWITEGRGCLDNEDEYRQETKFAFEAILKLIENVQHPAQKRFWEVMNGK